MTDHCIKPVALYSATRPLPSLVVPPPSFFLSAAYMFLSENRQCSKSKWAEFNETSFGSSMQSDWLDASLKWFPYMKQPRLVAWACKSTYSARFRSWGFEVRVFESESECNDEESFVGGHGLSCSVSSGGCDSSVTHWLVDEGIVELCKGKRSSYNNVHIIIVNILSIIIRNTFSLMFLMK